MCVCALTSFRLAARIFLKCRFFIQTKFLMNCEKFSNFAQVEYECVRGKNCLFTLIPYLLPCKPPAGYLAFTGASTVVYIVVVCK